MCGVLPPSWLLTQAGYGPGSFYSELLRDSVSISLAIGSSSQLVPTALNFSVHTSSSHPVQCRVQAILTVLLRPLSNSTSPSSLVTKSQLLPGMTSTPPSGQLPACTDGSSTLPMAMMLLTMMKTGRRSSTGGWPTVVEVLQIRGRDDDGNKFEGRGYAAYCALVAQFGCERTLQISNSIENFIFAKQSGCLLSHVSDM